MKFVVTGATGFVGQHLVPCLIARGHKVIAVARDRQRAETFSWFRDVEFLRCDIHSCDSQTISRLAAADAVVHLAWRNLPNYGELFHIEENYPASYRFLKALVAAGAKHLLVTGTCFEYGMQNGCLTEDAPVEPNNPYAISKDFLRRSLEALSEKFDFELQWARLFYVYGPGQNANSLMTQLNAAISRGDQTFNMSGGEQLRDFLPIADAARLLTALIESPNCTGIFNVCSGRPTSVRTLVESRLRETNAPLHLNLGYYPYPLHEPLAFWGNRQKLDRLL